MSSRYIVKVNDTMWKIFAAKKSSFAKGFKDLIHPDGSIVVQFFKFVKKGENSIDIEELSELRDKLKKKNIKVLGLEQADKFLENQHYIPREWKSKNFHSLLFGGWADKFGQCGFSAHRVIYLWYDPGSEQWMKFFPVIESFDYWNSETDKLVCVVLPPKKKKR